MPARGLDAFSKADQAEARGREVVRGLRRVERIGDDDLQVIAVAPQQHVHAAGRAVLEGVRQPLLHDAVGDDVDAERQDLRGVALVAHDHVPSGHADRFDDGPQAREARLIAGVDVVGGAQHGEHRTDLGEHVARGRADRGERLAGLLRAGVECRARHSRVQADDRDLVGDGVVQVAGDAQSFLAHAAPGLGFARLLRAAGALEHGGDVGAAGAGGIPQRPGERDRQTDL